MRWDLEFGRAYEAVLARLDYMNKQTREAEKVIGLWLGSTTAYGLDIYLAV